MKALTRPTLLILARQGLFLAVVWGVGQWWHVHGQSHIATMGLKSAVVVLAVNSAASMRQKISLTPSSEFDWREIGSRYSSQPDFDVPGLCSWYGGGCLTLAFDHWHFGTIFALFYSVLKWVNRKRPEVTDS